MNIWPNSYKNSPKCPKKRLKITLKSANHKKLKNSQQKHTFCAFFRNCVVQDNFLYWLVSPCPFFLAKTLSVDNNTFLLCVPNVKIWKIAHFSATLLEKILLVTTKKNSAHRDCTQYGLTIASTVPLYPVNIWCCNFSILSVISRRWIFFHGRFFHFFPTNLKNAILVWINGYVEILKFIWNTNKGKYGQKTVFLN